MYQLPCSGLLSVRLKVGMYSNDAEQHHDGSAIRVLRFCAGYSLVLLLVPTSLMFRAITVHPVLEILSLDLVSSLLVVSCYTIRLLATNPCAVLFRY